MQPRPIHAVGPRAIRRGVCTEFRCLDDSSPSPGHHSRTQTLRRPPRSSLAGLARAISNSRSHERFPQLGDACIEMPSLSATPWDLVNRASRYEILTGREWIGMQRFGQLAERRRGQSAQAASRLPGQCSARLRAPARSSLTRHCSSMSLPSSTHAPSRARVESSGHSESRYRQRSSRCAGAIPLHREHRRGQLARWKDVGAFNIRAPSPLVIRASPVAT